LSGALSELLTAALARSRAHIAGPAGEVWRSAAILALARRAAAALAARGVQAAEPVHVTIGNRPEDLGALLGVWVAGAVAVPVHRTVPAAAARRLRRKTRARFLLDAGELAAIGAAPPAARDLLAAAALVLFTSGSTGQPKGVVLGHAPFAGKLAVLSLLLELHPDDVVVVPLQLTFVFGLWVSLLALLAGARLLLVPRFAPEVVGDLLASGATVLAAVPSMLRILSAERAPAAPGLRAVFSGGEALGTSLARRVGATWPHAGLFDLYGSTETGSCDFCLRPADLPEGLGTIGRPTEQVAVRLSDENGAPLAAGASGELQIATPFGMLGYLDDPGLTAAAFSAGYFKTGDLARRRADGRIELVGRIKEIISRGGNKIAPAELENLFAGHPEVTSALCTGVPDERLGEAVHVMLVPRAGATLGADALRRWAAARIERHKLPDGIHLTPALPLGPTGKADRAALARWVLQARRGAVAD
jgi:long-chain acyl-CoA synthetase